MATRVTQPHIRSAGSPRDLGPLNWAARLSQHRASTFVGRGAQLQLLRGALRAEHSGFQVLFIHGVPGAGKTTLLKRFAAECDAAGVGYRLLDARGIQPLPKPFWRALRTSLGLREDEALTPALARRGRFFLMIDNYHKLHPLHDWLCETVLPLLPDSTVVVLASRGPLPELWRTDPAWRRLVRPVSLENFSPEETRVYLRLRAVPEAMHERLLRFSRGHPLALSLAADLYEQGREFTLNPLAMPDVVQTLTRRFLSDVVNPRRRAALEAAAIVWVVTEGVLAALLNTEDARAEFEWLCQLSFVDYASTGVYLHELVREALSQELLWRNPRRYEELRRRAHAFYAPLLRHPDEDVQREALADYLFLYRSHDALRPFLEESAVLPKTEPARKRDYAQMEALVRRYEGDESARMLLHWLRHQPESAWVIRADDGQLLALAVFVRLSRANEAHVREDPLTRAIWEYLQARRLLRDDDVATVTRFNIVAETYQAPSPPMASLAVALLRHCLTVPNLKFTFNIMAQPEMWEPFARASGFFLPVPELRFTVGRRRMGVFMQDWRWESPAMWLSRIAPEHERTPFVEAADSGPPGRAADDGANENRQLMERRTAFARAVRHALKNFHVPDALASNPLVDAAFVRRTVGEGATSDGKARALQACITEVVEFLGTVPKREKLYQALRYTYLEPQGSQEQVAEWLDLPFSTYRGHLRAGIDVLTDILWRKDVDARAQAERGQEPVPPARTAADPS